MSSDPKTNGECKRLTAQLQRETLGGGSREAPTEGAEFDFAQLKGKVVLINNVATM